MIVCNADILTVNCYNDAFLLVKTMNRLIYCEKGRISCTNFPVSYPLLNSFLDFFFFFLLRYCIIVVACCVVTLTVWTFNYYSVYS